MIFATELQVSYWKDGVTLFNHSLAVTGDCLTTVYNLAVAYGRSERFAEMEAFVDLKIAKAKNPLNKGKLEALKGIACYNEKKYKLAIESAEKAIELGDTGDSVYWTLAISNYHLGNLDEAARSLAKAKVDQRPANQASLIEVQRETGMTVLERILKENASAKTGSSSHQ